MGRSPGGVVAEMGRSVQENEVEEEEEEEYSGRLTDHTSGQLDDGKSECRAFALFVTNTCVEQLYSLLHTSRCGA